MDVNNLGKEQSMGLALCMKQSEVLAKGYQEMSLTLNQIKMNLNDMEKDVKLAKGLVTRITKLEHDISSLKEKLDETPKSSKSV
jgi:hypothetical protein